MPVHESIFFNVILPNATTWFYFSLLLAVALFFKFSRLLSIRNLDVLGLFLPMPGFLLMLEGKADRGWAYLWLVGACFYWFVRCLFDLVLVRRPALAPNLSRAGLAWLGGALYVSLFAIAGRPTAPPPAEEPPQTPIDGVVRQPSEDLLRSTASDEIDVPVVLERGLTLACHLAIAVGLILIGLRHFEDLHAGMAAGTFYLLMPYTYLLMPYTPLGVGRWDHAWPAALVVWAVFAYRLPAVSGSLMGLAAGSVFFPVLAFPAWLSFYWRRGAARFAVAFLLTAGLCLATAVAVEWIYGKLPGGLRFPWDLTGWLPWLEPPGRTDSFWHGIHWAYRLPVFILFVALVGVTLFWPSPKDLAHLIALTASVFLGIQFWYADKGGVYVLWYLPLLLLMVFRPNLTAAKPPPRPGDAEWLGRLGQWLWGLVQRMVGRRPVRARVG